MTTKASATNSLSDYTGKLFKRAILKKDKQGEFRNDTKAAKAADKKEEKKEPDKKAEPTQEQPEPKPQPPPPPRPRTKEDEEIYVHTGTIKEEKTPTENTPPKRTNSKTKTRVIHHIIERPSPTGPIFSRRTSHTRTSSGETDSMEGYTQQPPPPSPSAAPPVNIIDDMLERLNLQKVVALMKKIFTALSERIVNSEYVNTDSTGQIHLQSFGLGLGLSGLMVFLYPYFAKHLDSWFGMVGTLVRHGMLWIGIGLVLSYALNPRNGGAKPPVSAPKERQNHFTELQYHVKSSRTASPTKSAKSAPPRSPQYSRRPSAIQRRETEPAGVTTRAGLSDAQMLVSMTEQKQFLERAKLDAAVQLNRPPTQGYEKFMDGALKKEGEREKYANFVDGALRTVEEKERYAQFIGAARPSVVQP